MTPMPRTSLLMTWIYTGIIMLIFLPSSISLLIDGQPASFLALFLLSFMCTVLLVLWTVTGVGRYWARRMMDHEFRASRWGSLLLALQRARLPIRRAGAKATTRALSHLQRECVDGDAHCPRSIIDLRFATSIATIQLDPNMIEPEPIFAGPAKRNRDRIAAFIGGGLLLLIGLLSGNMYCTIIGAASLIIPIVSLQIVRRHSAALRGGIHRLVAGQGFVRSLKGATWTNEDSFCIVRALNRRTRRTCKG